MILDFTFKQVMKMSNLKRWAIIEMSREQSVAEHSYNVAMISGFLAREVENLLDFSHSTGLEEDCIKWALCHDLTEVLTGDIPTPVKSLLKPSLDHMEKTLCPQYTFEKEDQRSMVLDIVKAADFIDALQFAHKFCIDYNREIIIGEMEKKLKDHINSSITPYVQEAVDLIWRS